MFKITNQSEGRIVLNSLNVVLSSNGVSGDSSIIPDEKRSDREVLSLEMAGVIVVEKQTAKSLKKTQNVVEEPVKEPKKTKKRYKSGGPDGDRNKATFISEGKVNTGKMVQSIEQDGDLPDPLTADDQAREKDDDNSHIFVK